MSDREEIERVWTKAKKELLFLIVVLIMLTYLLTFRKAKKLNDNKKEGYKTFS